MADKKYSKEQIEKIVARSLSDTIFELEDPSLLIVGTLVMAKLRDMLK